MRKLSKYEKETIINWNEGENIASIYTFNASLKRSHYRVKDEVPWRVEGGSPIGSRVKRLAQGKLMPASTCTGYYLTQNSAGLAASPPSPARNSFAGRRKNV